MNSNVCCSNNWLRFILVDDFITVGVFDDDGYHVRHHVDEALLLALVEVGKTLVRGWQVDGDVNVVRELLVKELDKSTAQALAFGEVLLFQQPEQVMQSV